MIVHDAANRVVRLRIGAEDCALRMPLLDDAQLRVDRHSEQAALLAAASVGITADVLACDPTSGVLITRWIDEPVWTPEQTHLPENLESIAALLRRLHRLPAPPNVRRLDLSALIHGYWNTLRAQQTRLPPQLPSLHLAAVNLLNRRPAGEERLCHNDLHAGNIIGPGSHIRLLDWEYSGIGEPLFDLASYTQSNDLSPPQCEFLLQAYGATDEMRERFATEQRLFDWTCVLWLTVSGAHRTSSGAQRLTQLIQR